MNELTTFRCPCCGGEMTYDISKQKLTCPYCDTSFDVETLQTFEKEIQQNYTHQMKRNEEVHDSLNDEDYIIYSCEQCGGQIITERQTIASICPYCHSPVVFNKNVENEFKPDYIIPFQFDNEAAKTKFQQYLAIQKFIPRSLKKNEILENVKEIYVPFWAFHCLADVKHQYHVERHEYYSDNDYDYTKINHYQAIREGTIEFENVPVDASSKIDKELIQSIEPFDLTQAVPFQKAYLAGHFANKYDMDAKTCEEQANKRIKTTIQQTFNNTVKNCNSSRLEQSQIVLKNKKYDYYLLPIWILSFKWQKKQYMLMMNGQTGEIAGETPADMKAFGKSILIYTIVIAFFIFMVISGME